jgi:protein-L-isoaspartate(D-aspartate) O-methyltransferase
MTAREELILSLRREGFLRTQRVISAFRSVPREGFLPGKLSEHAYSDQPLPIGRGQTISAPHMVAVMTELLEPDSRDIVLEVGAGSGYQAAILSKLVKEVFTVELEGELTGFARSNLERAGIRNVEVIHGDGSRGLPEKAPFDKILVTCAVEDIPAPLIGQLKEGGIVTAPVGPYYRQTLVSGVKEGKKLRTARHFPCIFVPLRH